LSKWGARCGFAVVVVVAVVVVAQILMGKTNIEK